MNNKSTPSEVLLELLQHSKEQYKTSTKAFDALPENPDTVVKRSKELGVGSAWLDVQLTVLNNLNKLLAEPGYTQPAGINVLETEPEKAVASRFSETGLIGLFFAGVILGMWVMILVLR